ncbi:MAG TPA: hypothetical protein VGR69_03220 [Candidatus Rubrimentiphilum sp.]|nr:hypothetical protein [Candidatus Rubrimentiphilum sp.]
MFDVAASLTTALESASENLQSAAAAASRSQTPLGSSRTDKILAAAADRAIFTEAVLNAVHARLAEIKSVTHG